MNRRLIGGFTLLEMIVSLAIFAVVAVIAVGALVRVVGLNRRAQTLQSSMTDLSFILESMSRDMRTGSKFDCMTVPADSTSLQTWSFAGNPVATACSLSASSLYAANRAAVVVFNSSRFDSSGNSLLTLYAFIPVSGGWEMGKAEQLISGTPIGLTGSPLFSSLLVQDPNVTLTDFRLAVTVPGTSPVFSRAFFRLIGFAGDRTQDINNFDIETSVSQRISD